jgi:1,5-anhydro-D-fructose reductase (1,5-anhydro-D-mannitol-forming)
MSDIGWGFIGASLWAERWIVPGVRAVPGTHPVAVFSSSEERGGAFAERLGLTRSYADLDDLLANPAIDAVYVSSTNNLHAAQTIAAARAGKHVLCEKPLATSFADAVQMVQECRSAGVVLATNHHYRASPAIAQMRRLIAAGEIGELLAANVSHAVSLPRQMRTWRTSRPEAGAGVALDITVHDADLVRYLLDDEIVEVTALTANQGLADPAIEDSVMAVMRTGRGQLVSTHEAFTVAHAGTAIEVHGGTGSLIGRELLSAEPIGDLYLRRLNAIEPVEISSRSPLYERAILQFVAAVRGEGQPLATGEDGVASLSAALAVLRSAHEQRAVVPETI